MEEEYELMSLAPDMSEVWGRVMRVLRERDEIVLYALCSEIDAQFEREHIILVIKDDGVHQLVSKHKKKLDEIAGEGVIEIHRTHKKKENPLSRKLQELFGEKLDVVR